MYIGLLSIFSVQNVGFTTANQYWEEARQVKEIRMHPDCNPGMIRMHPDCTPGMIRKHPDNNPFIIRKHPN